MTGATKAVEGKVALVTGASRGIGAAFARLADAGVALGLASRPATTSGSPELYL